jgi:uncharacterized protein YjeT (DUF2065 family)
MYPSSKGVQLTRAPGRSAWGVSFPSKASDAMAEQPPSIQFEDIPLDQARRMGLGPRMAPELYRELRARMQSLSDQAVRIHLGPEITPTRMKNYILSIARELAVPVTVRRMPGGLIFWRSTVEDIELAQEVAERLQTARHRPQARPRGRQPRGTR